MMLLFCSSRFLAVVGDHFSVLVGEGVASLTLGSISSNSVSLHRYYDPVTGRLTENGFNQSSGVSHYGQLAYDPAGNLIQFRSSNAGYWYADNQCFGYDDLQRLTQAWTPRWRDSYCDGEPGDDLLDGPSPYWTSWVFDTIGNMVSKAEHEDADDLEGTVTSFGHPIPGPLALGPHQVTTAEIINMLNSQNTYTHDAAGNMTSRLGPSGDTQTLVWDDSGDLIEVAENSQTVAQMVYATDGRRLIRQQGSDTTLYVAGAEITSDGTITTTVRYYNHAGMTIALRTGNTNVTGLIPDWHNTTQAQFDYQTGDLTMIWLNPYGQPRDRQTPPGWKGEKGFVGGTNDQITGLTRIGARDYDPETNTFITTDPVLPAGDITMLNPYTYGLNNPWYYTDPTGLRLIDDWVDGHATAWENPTNGKVTKYVPPKPKPPPPSGAAGPGRGNRPPLPGPAVPPGPMSTGGTGFGGGGGWGRSASEIPKLGDSPTKFAYFAHNWGGCSCEQSRDIGMAVAITYTVVGGVLLLVAAVGIMFIPIFGELTLTSIVGTATLSGVGIISGIRGLFGVKDLDDWYYTQCK